MQYQGKTQQEWQDDINAYTFSLGSKWLEVMERLYPFSQFEFDHDDQTEGELLYNEILPFQMVDDSRVYDTKLPWQDVVDELTEYISESLSGIDLRFRTINLFNWYDATRNTETLDSFDEFWLFSDHVVENNLDAELTILEAEDSDLLAESQFQEGVREKVARINIGIEAIATINKMNEDAGITTLQLQAILIDPDIQNAMISFQTGSLLTGQAIINAKDISLLPPLSQAHKDKINSLIDGYLGV